MRIQRVSFQHINSILGPCTINFDAIGTNLFLITGPTGSGKSTILDAITLALYGRTSRQEKINGSFDEIMTKGENTCESTVWFEEGGDHYEARWKHRRKNSRKKGELGGLEVPKHALLKNGTLVSDKYGAIEDALYSITGMRYDQFVQAVMLAQGGFSKFLSAPAKEKSGILTQLTGTNIYQQIGQKVYEKTKALKLEEDNTLTRMKEIHVMDAQEKEALEARLSQLENERTLLVQGEEKGNEILWQWESYEEQEKVLSAIALAKQELATMEEEGEALRRAYAEDQKLNPLTPLDTRLNGAEKREREIAGDLLQKQAELALANDNRDKADKEREEVKKRAEKALLEISAREEALQNAKVADGQLPSLRANLQDAQRRLQEKRDEITRKQKELDKLRSQISSLEEQKEKANTYLHDHASHSHLAEILPTLREKTSEMETQRRMVEQARKTRDGASSQLQETQKHIESSLAALDALKKSISDKEQKLAALKQRVMDSYHGESSKSLQAKKAQLQEANSLARAIMSLEERRSHLIEGEPCPLCGSLSHPYMTGTPRPDVNDEAIRLLNKTIPELEALEKEIDETNNAISLSLQERKQKEETLSEYKANLPIQQETLDTQEKSLVKEEEYLYSLLKEISTVLAPYGVSSWTENTRATLESLQGKWEEAKVLTKQAQDQLAILIHQRETDMEHVAGLSTAEEEKKVSDAKEAVAAKEEEISQLLWGKSIELAQKEIADGRESVERVCKAAEDNFSRAKNRVSTLEGSLESLSAQKAQAKEEREEFARTLLEKLGTLGIGTIEEFHSKLLTEEQREKAREDEKALLAKREELKGLGKRLPSPLLSQPSIPKEKAAEQVQEAKASLQVLDQQKGKDEEKRNRDKEDNERLHALKGEYQKQHAEYLEWDQLCDLIGDAKGEKFQSFAQNISFRALIDYANEHLQKLDERYLLRASDDDALMFYVYDAAQDIQRPVTNLSGGESFLVSLALALGLASFSPGKTPIESLFLDEGFGTLDQETLEVAMKALGSLHHGGKQIGIISHVEMLKERIPNQIGVTKDGMGHSKVSGKGVTMGD